MERGRLSLSSYIEPTQPFVSTTVATVGRASSLVSMRIRMMKPRVKLGLQRHCIVHLQSLRTDADRILR